MSTPSRVMRPSVTSYSRGTNDGEGRLPAAGDPDDGEGLAGADLEVDVVEHTVAAPRVAEADALEAQPALDDARRASALGRSAISGSVSNTS